MAYAPPAAWAVPVYTRHSGELIIELSSRSPVPQAPYELQQACDGDLFAQRMETLKRHLRRYSWNVALRVYVFIVGALSFITPWPIMLLANNTYGRIDTSFDTTDDFGNVFLTDAQVRTLQRARFITFGIILGLLLVLWGPYSLYKYLGLRRRRALLASWTAADCAPARPQATHLRWGVRSCSTFRGRAQAVVNLPMQAWGGVSSFHPQAYLPEYIMAADKGAFAPPAGPPPGHRGAYNDHDGYADEKV